MMHSSCMICFANQMTGFYMRCSTGLKWVTHIYSFVIEVKYDHVMWFRNFKVYDRGVFTSFSNTLIELFYESSQQFLTNKMFDRVLNSDGCRPVNWLSQTRKNLTIQFLLFEFCKQKKIMWEFSILWKHEHRCVHFIQKGFYFLVFLLILVSQVHTTS